MELIQKRLTYKELIMMEVDRLDELISKGNPGGASWQLLCQERTSLIKNQVDPIQREMCGICPHLERENQEAGNELGMLSHPKIYSVCSLCTGRTLSRWLSRFYIERSL